MSSDSRVSEMGGPRSAKTQKLVYRNTLSDVSVDRIEADRDGVVD